jgi:hypothetical protein
MTPFYAEVQALAVKVFNYLNTALLMEVEYI